MAPTAELYLVAVVAAIGIFCQLLLLSRGAGNSGISPYLYNTALYWASFVIFVCLEIIWLLFNRRPQSPLAEVLNHARQEKHLIRLRSGAPLLVTLIVFMPMFSDMKSSIALFNPYGWDEVFIAADRLIFGTDAWRVLQPIIGYPIVTSALSGFYHLWIVLIYGGSIFFAVYQQPNDLRFRYFTSFFAIWIICGIVLATLMASVGPCFVGPILGMDTFDDQMHYLDQANSLYPVLVLDVQHELLEWYRLKAYGLGRGITAMPSMHVALAFLFFLATRMVSPKLGLVFGAFFVIIFVGSVHLAYHYAVDGLVAVAVTWLIWVLSGRLVHSAWYRMRSAQGGREGDQTSCPASTTCYPTDRIG